MLLARMAGGAIGAYLGYQAARRAAGQLAPPTAPGKRIVILGGGFAGASAATRLARLLPRDDDAEIVVVDQRDYLLFTPMLTEVAGGEVSEEHIVRSLRTLSHRIRYVRGAVQEVDVRARQVRLQTGDEQDAAPAAFQTIQADELVLALGARPAFHRVPGAQEHALTIDSLSDAAVIRNRALAILEHAPDMPPGPDRTALLTCVVAGGGATGVEIMAAINDLLRHSAGISAGIDPGDVRAVLVAPESELLTELETPSLSRYALRHLQRRGVEVRLNAQVARCEDGYVELKGGERIDAQTVIWAAGIAPRAVTRSMDCRKGKHGLLVDSCGRLLNTPHVWAAGDCAEMPKPGGDGTYSPTAQNATREGAHVARNIVAALRGGMPTPFQYRNIGELALVGRRSGVASVYGAHVAGLPAWLLWRGIYLFKTPGSRQRAHVLLDWLLDAFFGRSLARLPAPALKSG